MLTKQLVQVCLRGVHGQGRRDVYNYGFSVFSTIFYHIILTTIYGNETTFGGFCVSKSFKEKDINQTFLKKTLIFGDVDKVYKDDVYNAILLKIKYYIYTNRCLKKKLSFHSLKACLIDLYKTEKMIAVRNQRIAEFQLHWSTFEKLFEDC